MFKHHCKKPFMCSCELCKKKELKHWQSEMESLASIENFVKFETIMSVKAKFVCTRSEQLTGQDAHTITLIPVYAGSKENDEFFKSTPGGSIHLTVVNEKAAEQFVEGEEYFIDFTKVAKPEKKQD